MLNTQVSANEIFPKISELLIKTGFERQAINPQASFTHDLGFDSLDYTEFIMNIENAFSITLPFEQLEKECNTIGDLERIIIENLAK
ncbi:MAG: acyl carrier protein [Spirosomaceae bacterium]|nr:acyl carrier protein [Spirosomataceae bacterium]MDP5140052.1 acyl carrier protein [Spirosomataceae bacterium]